MSLVDLNELAKRESERVEWKENIADIQEISQDIAKTAVAFANDYANLGGGYIVCGVREDKDEFGFQKMTRIGLTSSRLKEVEGKLLAVLRENATPSITPTIEEIPVDEEHRILVFIVPASINHVHSLRLRSGENPIIFYREGRETRIAQNGVFRELLTQKNAAEPWDWQGNYEATIEDIDLLVLRDFLQETGIWNEKMSLEDYLSPTNRIFSLTPPLTFSKPPTNQVCPRNFSLLLFAKELTKSIPGAYTIFSVYPGSDRSEPISEKKEILGSVINQAKKCIELLNMESSTIFDKESKFPNQRKYPQRALQEAVVNAIVHRDYEINQPTRITVFSDRIEFSSPGALPRTIDKTKFIEGKATPHWRNQSLTFFFNKLQLSQAEGQGIPTIFRTMREEGCPRPQFDFEAERVICTLPAHPRHKLIKC